MAPIAAHHPAAPSAAAIRSTAARNSTGGTSPPPSAAGTSEAKMPASRSAETVSGPSSPLSSEASARAAIPSSIGSSIRSGVAAMAGVSARERTERRLCLTCTDGRSGRNDQVRDAGGPLGDRADRARLRDRLPRGDGRQRGAAGDRRGPRRRRRRAAVDAERVPADARGADPDRRLARRPLRAPAPVHDRRDLVRRRLRPLRARSEHRGARHRPGLPGDRRGAADAGQPRDHRIRLPSRGPGAGDRRLVGARRDRRRDRAARRRLADRRGRLARDLPDQHPDRRLRRLGRAPATCPNRATRR